MSGHHAPFCFSQAALVGRYGYINLSYPILEQDSNQIDQQAEKSNNLAEHIVRSVAQFHLCVHTFKVKQATWDNTVSPARDLCDAQDDVQDEQHLLFKRTHPHVCSLRLRCASLFSGLLLSLSHSSNRVAPYVPGIHHVQSLAVNRSDWGPSFFL
eukprot:1136436-Pelagomonas_calceolata.AAC.1